jgi:hypothetical protein
LIHFLFVLITGAFGQDVLVLWDSDTAAEGLADSLTADGFTVTWSDTIEYEYDGTNPSPEGFDVVVHLNGETWSSTMPLSGQEALVEFVQNGGGFVSEEWNAFQVATGDYGANFENLVLLDRNGKSRQSDLDAGRSRKGPSRRVWHTRVGGVYFSRGL